MADDRGIGFRLGLTLGVIALVALAGLLAILPYRLYERDIRQAAHEAHRLSAVVQAALDCPLGAEPDVGTLVERIQGVGNVRIALARLEAGQVQPGAMAGRGSSVLDDTDLRYVSAPVMDADGAPWIAEMHFDLSPMKRESVRLIVDLVVAVAVGAALFSAAIGWLFRRQLVLPLRELLGYAERLRAGETPPRPRFESREMNELAAGLEALRPGAAPPTTSARGARIPIQRA